MSDDTPADIDAADAPAVVVAPKSKALVYALIGAGVLLTGLGILVAVLLLRGAPPEGALSAPPRGAPAPSVVPSTLATPSPSIVAPAPVAPAPVAPAPVNPAPAPPAPAPPAPAPATPPVIPLKFTSMDATVSGACTTTSTILLTWTTVGATANSAIINVRTGGGTPVFNQSWIDMPASGSYTFLNLDCTRPIWFFKMTITNGTEAREALLTFANGKTAGWSSVAK